MCIADIDVDTRADGGEGLSGLVDRGLHAGPRGPPSTGVHRDARGGGGSSHVEGGFSVCGGGSARSWNGVPRERHARPPRVAEWLLRLVLPHGIISDSIVGDAQEEYVEYVRSGGVAPAAWYWMHAARLAGGYVITKGRDVEVGAILKDLKYGARSLLRMPGSAAVAVVVLAIGIGLCSFMFSLVYGIYFRGLPIPDADQVFLVYETRIERDQLQRNVPIQNFADWRERQTSFQALMATYGGTVNIAGSEEPTRFQGSFITANGLSMIGVEPIIGRTFASGDDAPGSALNVVLGYSAWRDNYGGDPAVVGRDVRVNGEPGTILGVMPEGFKFPGNADVWLPLRDDPIAIPRGQGGRRLTVYGRLREGVSRDQASLEMAGIARGLEQEYPEFNEGIGAQLYTPVQADMDETLNMVFGSMMFAVLCVLLVACANVANLLLARASMRTKEAGVRVAMGGSRLRVMIPFFSEALILAAVGALLGIGITYGAVGWFDGVTDPARTGRPWFMQFKVDLPILGFIVGLTGFTALVAGVAPAFKMSRTDVSTVLKDESRGASSLHVGKLTRILVTAEVALSVALLVGAGLMTKSIVKLGNAEYPFETERVFTARVGLFPTVYPDATDRQELWRDLVAELAGLSEVSASGLTDILPYDGRNAVPIAFDGVDYEAETDLPELHRAIVTPGFFAALGVEVVSGRDFVEQDETDSELVAIVNQPLVERYFGGGNAIGRRFREGVSDTLPLITVVGVAPDLHMAGPAIQGEDFEPAGYYVPLKQADASFMSLAALTRGGNATSITGDVRAAVRRVDPDLPVYEVFSEADVIDRQMWFYSVFGTVFIMFGLAALFMASVGLYGVLSFAVSRRTQEMGIRMALGAASRDVIGLVAKQGAAQLGLGLAIGSVLAFGVTRVVGILMYQVDPQDPMVFGGVLSLIVVVGMSAAIFPARRATSVNPVQALRSE